MKKQNLILLILLALVVSACNMPGNNGSDTDGSDDAMATEIAKILTGTPIEVEPSPTPLPEEEETTAPEPTNTPEEPTATPEPTDTPTAEPTPTLSDTDPAQTLGEPDWIDNMENGDNWATGFSDYTSIEFDDGYLQLTAEEDVDGWRLSWPVLDNFYLEAKVQSPECEGRDHYGLMFRVPENANANKGYLFGITCDGQYSLRRWDGETMHFPVAWTESDAINSGEDETNILGVMADGANLALYINGEKVTQLTDNAYLTGKFGLFVGADNVEDLTVWVDYVRYWDLP